MKLTMRQTTELLFLEEKWTLSPTFFASKPIQTRSWEWFIVVKTSEPRLTTMLAPVLPKPERERKHGLLPTGINDIPILLRQ